LPLDSDLFSGNSYRRIDAGVVDKKKAYVTAFKGLDSTKFMWDAVG
jgi:hypothetical protein